MLKKTLFAIPTLLAVAAIPASATTFLQFVQDNGTDTPFVVTNGGGTISISVTNYQIIDYKFSVANPLGTGFRSGRLSLSATSTQSATGPTLGVDSEGGFSGTGSIFDLTLSQVVFSWTFG